MIKPRSIERMERCRRPVHRGHRARERGRRDVAPPERGRRAFVLPVVLVLVGLLAVTIGGFMFFVRAEVSGIEAQRDAQQARLSAESGLQEVIMTLRASPHDQSAWWDVPDTFQHALVWAETYMREDDPARKMGSRKEILALSAPPVAWRYSVVAPNLDGPIDTIRFGITPEASKLNLNSASDVEIEQLVLPLLIEMGVQNAPDLVAALLDWRDEDDEVRPGGAETAHYNTLTPGYNCKNGPLDTVEEILLIKDWSAAVLWGEDANRNGLLDANEDDGDASEPRHDNADGLLNLGLAPFVTVWSREPGVASQGGPTGGQPTGGQPGAPAGGGGLPTGEGQSRTGAPATKRNESGWKDLAGAEQDPNDLLGELDTGTLQPGGTGGTPTSGAPGAETGQPRLGLVNVNTAPLRVLQALEGMDPDEAQAIVSMRAQLASDMLAEPDWILANDAVSDATWQAIKDKVTTKAYQYHIEIVAYGDHTKFTKRYEWVIELRGQLVQVLYHRDLTPLGAAWPLDDDRYIVRNR